MLGELNYVFSSKFKLKDLSRVNAPARQAAAASLVRQHLAMQSLRAQGGASLESILDQHWQTFVSELDRQGIRLDDYCRRYQTTEKAVRASRDWETAWQMYLKSRLTDANLERFYEAHHQKYAARKWNVSHLFLPIDEDQPSAASLAEDRLDRILGELTPLAQSPNELAEKFAELAKSESDGATSEQGGRIGWVDSSGDLPPAVVAQVRATPVGALSEPVKTPQGIHLILVHDASSTRVPFSQLTDASQLQRDAANALFEALIERQSDARVSWYIQSLKPPVIPATPQ